MTKWQTPCIHFIGEKERERGRIHTGSEDGVDEITGRCCEIRCGTARRTRPHRIHSRCSRRSSSVFKTQQWSTKGGNFFLRRYLLS